MGTLLILGWIGLFTTSVDAGEMNFQQGFPARLSTNIKATGLMHELKERPVQEHALIYSKILVDTAVLNHPGLRIQIIRLAKRTWYWRYIRGNQLGRGKPLQGDPEFLFAVYDLFTQVANHLEGRSAVVVGLYLIPRGPNRSLTLENKLIKAGEETLEEFLERADYKKHRGTSRWRADDRDVGSHREFRKNASASELARNVLFRIYARQREDIFPLTLLRLRLFAWNVLEDPNDISGLKTFTAAILLEEGVSPQRIREELVQPDRIMEPLNEPDTWIMKGDFIKKKILEKANEWRKSFNAE